jgi:hypothetical protein
MANVVVSALVLTKKEDGSDLYLYEGSELPDFVKADEVKRLVGLGFVEDSSKAKKPTSESN